MSPETILALFHKQLDSLYSEMALATSKGHRFRVSLYMGETFIGEPLFVALPRRKVDNSRHRDSVLTPT